jgi:fermentation-respiration switch protein FrsA (DUF1100 family)
MSLLKRKLSLLIFLVPVLASAQSSSRVEGTWEGALNVGVDLRIVFHIRQHSTGSLSGTMDSPDQSAFEIPCDTVFFRSDTLTIEMYALKASYQGRLVNDSTLNGVFTQGIPLPLDLKKVETPSEKKRSQIPRPPFPYTIEQVSYFNTDQSIRFGATLTIPPGPGPFPAVVLISGSGPQDRNSTLLGHPVFEVLADHLTRHGIMVLRYDDRGVGETGGDFSGATSADFALDAAAGVDFLKRRKEADPKKLGLVGHSEGGMIAPMVANSREDISFVVLLAAPGVPIIDLMAEQNVAVARAGGVPENALNEIEPLFRNVVQAVRDAKDERSATEAVNTVLGRWMEGKDVSVLEALNLSAPTQQAEYVHAMVTQLRMPWFAYFINYDPAHHLKKLKGKVLALNGDRDIQVVSKQNLPAIRALLEKGKAEDFEIHELTGMNHLFQTCSKCTVDEYGDLEETFSPVALRLITNWLEKEIK